MKQVLIVFPDEWVAYSPTVLNMVNALSGDFEVTVLAFDNGLYDNSSLEAGRYTFINLPTQPSRLLYLIGLYKPLKAFLLTRRIRKLGIKQVIAIDSIGLWSSLKCVPTCDYLSLEVIHDFYFRHSDKSRIQSIVIQTPERYKYLFGKLELPCFYIQNAPPLARPIQQNKLVDRCEAVYFGNIIPRHGIYFCLDALQYTSNVRLTVKGRIPAKVKKTILRKYSSLIKNDLLVLDETYLEADDIVEYLSRFHTGFCLYDMNMIDRDDFNYLSVPSGKLFYYYAAGVPVIGSDILGLKTISECHTGVTLTDLSPESIAAAMNSIIEQHDTLSANCLVTARQFDFNSSVAPFKQYLTDKSSGNPDNTRSH